MKKSESLLWQKIKKLNLKGQIFRIESNTINGIPDVFYLKRGNSFWIELKSNDSNNLGLSKYQINWHLKHFKHGGRSFILREYLSQREVKTSLFQLFVVREPRNLVLVCEEPKLINIFSKNF
tara:strand:+ start:176 stop:541 length:366 start_codon:yes stop_codon:yes gene_type:complete